MFFSFHTDASDAYQIVSRPEVTIFISFAYDAASQFKADAGH